MVKPVERYTVYEVYVQLLGERLMPGMDYAESLTYQNMTDQMLHLVRQREGGGVESTC